MRFVVGPFGGVVHLFILVPSHHIPEDGASTDVAYSIFRHQTFCGYRSDFHQSWFPSVVMFPRIPSLCSNDLVTWCLKLAGEWKPAYKFVL